MIFIHSDDRSFAAAFPQSVVQRLRPGSDAEIAFDAIPGRVFRGKVNALIDAVWQGQLQATGALLNPEDRSKTPGLALTTIEINDDLSGYQVPAARPHRSPSSDRWRPIGIARRIILRMNSRMNLFGVGELTRGRHSNLGNFPAANSGLSSGDDDQAGCHRPIGESPRCGRLRF